MPTFQAKKLNRVVRGIIQGTGSTEEEAATVADHLVLANLSGHDSHGVVMTTAYVSLYHEGLVKPNTPATCTNDAGAILQFDGGKGYGQRVATEATAAAVERTRETGVTLYTLSNAFHVGRIGNYGEQAIAEGFASIHFVNVADHTPSVAPFGGSDARLITNPVCIAVPGTAEQDPVILDMATSGIALGKVRVAYNKGVPVPDGTLLGPGGEPTTDPGVMFPELRGALTPFGLHKGSGLGLMSELLGGILSGGQTIQPGHKRLEGIVNNMFGIVFDPARLIDHDSYARELKAAVDYVKSSPPQDPEKPVLVAGDPERISRRKRGAEGIPLDDNTWEDLLASGESVGQSRDEMIRMVA